MAELLKNFLSPDFIGLVSDHFGEVYPSFPRQAFARRVLDDNWPSLELKQRFAHLATCLRAVLPAAWPQALEIAASVADRQADERGEKLSFEYLFLADFVAQYGLEDPELAIPALERITRWTSAEFAVRPFIKRYPELMYPQMLAWSAHPSAMVRRLSSEGFRPRLPWGMGIPALKKDPSPILPVLERLKNDPAETVRRSVANNLNDISKDHPALALSLATQWQGQSPETDWVVRHALRGLLKKGHAEALSTFGFEQNLPLVSLKLLECEPTVAIGQRFHFACSISNESNETVSVRLEYAIDYLTSSGKTSQKVFLIKHLELAAGQSEDFYKNQRFTDFTTRKHYPGRHRLGLLLNGQEKASAYFEVQAAS